jgi:uroporphyrinogen decarboxylase
MAKNPELACEVTLQPLARFPLDAAILFSDILTVPDAMGLGLYFADGEGPKFERPLRTPADIARLAVPDMETELRYVMDAVRIIRRELDGRVPLIGFSGSPWTLACYMVEGGGSEISRKIKAMALNEPAALHQLLVGGHRRGHRLPVRAARGRRAGAAGVRHLGRRPEPGDVSRVLAALSRPHRARPRTRTSAHR